MFIDIYDEQMHLLGKASLEQAHHEGLWHRVFHCWIVKPGKDGNHKVWLQLRSKEKPNSPNLLGVSAAGHLESGETARDGIKDIEKELGLSVDFSRLTKLFTDRRVTDRQDYHNREFNPTYVLETEAKLEDLTLLPGEVDGVYVAKIDDVADLFKGKCDSIASIGRIRLDDGSYKSEIRYVEAKDFVAADKAYYIKVMDMLQRYCDNCGKVS